MISTEPLTQLPAGTAAHAVPGVALDSDFETRRAAWVARGRVHDQRMRRRFVVSASVLSVGAVIVAIIYTLLRA